MFKFKYNNQTLIWENGQLLGDPFSVGKLEDHIDFIRRAGLPSEQLLRMPWGSYTVRDVPEDGFAFDQFMEMWFPKEYKITSGSPPPPPSVPDGAIP